MCLSCISSAESIIIGSAGIAGVAKTVSQNYLLPFSKSNKQVRDLKIWQQNRSFAAEMGLDPDTLFGDAPVEFSDVNRKQLEMQS